MFGLRNHLGDFGYAGFIDTTTMMTQFNFGYAIAGSNGGHSLAASGNTTYASYFDDVAELKAWIHNSSMQIWSKFDQQCYDDLSDCSLS
jgi:antibiotic biosynthesis monooxygenase (ABM) superfamily enzyme